jgi:dienelactone hydrolase
MKRWLMLALFLSFASRAGAKVITETVEYRHGDTVCQGWVAYDDAIRGRRPAVLLVHDWLGATLHQKEQIERLAALGYVALAADIYGKGVRPANAQEASAEAGKYYKDPALLRARVRAGLDYLASLAQADTSRLAAMGYCFGGRGALELARSGAPLRAVVTFHGSLATAAPGDAKNIRARVLVLHGADDPFVKQDEVRAFMDEMRAAGVDWQLVQYSGAVHSFTDPRAGGDNSKGAAYNAAADRRSWRAMRDFFEETLAK